MLPRETAAQVCLPFHRSSTVVVPESDHSTESSDTQRRILRDSPLKEYQPQALQHTVPVVGSNPHTVTSLF